jgi:hypothetical protein
MLRAELEQRCHCTARQMVDSFLCMPHFVRASQACCERQWCANDGANAISLGELPEVFPEPA